MSHEPPSDPPRTAPRLKTALPIRLPDGWSGEVLNLSTTGLRLRSIAMLPIGTPVDAVIEHPNREVALKAIVIWADPPQYDIDVAGEIGLALQEVSQDYLDLLVELFADSER
jgi:hypothetical protein